MCPAAAAAARCLPPLLRQTTVPPRTPTPPGGRRAAIAACFRINARGTASILFIRRAINPRDPWSGNVALPGGKQEADDADDEATAMRETQEEVGLDLSGWRRLGRLTEDRTIYPRGRPMVISCFGFFAEVTGTSIEPHLQESEVDSSWWVPASILTPEAMQWHSMPLQRLRPELQTRPRLLALSRVCGMDQLRFAAIPLPPPPPGSSAAKNHDGPPVLWGLTLAFLSDARRRSALAAPLIGAGAEGEFVHPYRTVDGGPLGDALFRAVLFSRGGSSEGWLKRAVITTAAGGGALVLAAALVGARLLG